MIVGRVYVVTAAGVVLAVHASAEGAARAVADLVDSPEPWLDATAARWAVWDVLP